MTKSFLSRSIFCGFLCIYSLGIELMVGAATLPSEVDALRSLAAALPTSTSPDVTALAGLVDGWWQAYQDAGNSVAGRESFLARVVLLHEDDIDNWLGNLYESWVELKDAASGVPTAKVFDLQLGQTNLITLSAASAEAFNIFLQMAERLLLECGGNEAKINVLLNVLSQKCGSFGTALAYWQKHFLIKFVMANQPRIDALIFNPGDAKWAQWQAMKDKADKAATMWYIDVLSVFALDKNADTTEEQKDWWSFVKVAQVLLDNNITKSADVLNTLFTELAYKVGIDDKITSATAAQKIFLINFCMVNAGRTGVSINPGWAVFVPLYQNISSNPFATDSGSLPAYFTNSLVLPAGSNNLYKFVSMANNLLQAWRNDSLPNKRGLDSLIFTLYSRYVFQDSSHPDQGGIVGLESNARKRFLNAVIAPRVTDSNFGNGERWQELKDHAVALDYYGKKLWQYPADSLKYSGDNANLGELTNDNVLNILTEMRRWGFWEPELSQLKVESGKLANLMDFLWDQWQVHNNDLSAVNKNLFKYEFARIREKLYTTNLSSKIQAVTNLDSYKKLYAALGKLPMLAGSVSAELDYLLDSTSVPTADYFASYNTMAYNLLTLSKLLTLWKDDATSLLLLIDKLYAKYTSSIIRLSAGVRRGFLQQVIIPMLNDPSFAATTTVGSGDNWVLLKQHAEALFWNPAAELGTLNDSNITNFVNKAISSAQSFVTTTSGLVAVTANSGKLSMLLEYLYAQYQLNFANLSQQNKVAFMITQISNLITQHINDLGSWFTSLDSWAKLSGNIDVQGDATSFYSQAIIREINNVKAALGASNNAQLTALIDKWWQAYPALSVDTQKEFLAQVVMAYKEKIEEKLGNLYESWVNLKAAADTMFAANLRDAFELQLGKGINLSVIDYVSVSGQDLQVWVAFLDAAERILKENYGDEAKVKVLLDLLYEKYGPLETSLTNAQKQFLVKFVLANQQRIDSMLTDKNNSQWSNWTALKAKAASLSFYSIFQLFDLINIDEAIKTRNWWTFVKVAQAVLNKNLNAKPDVINSLIAELANQTQIKAVLNTVDEYQRIFLWNFVCVNQKANGILIAAENTVVPETDWKRFYESLKYTTFNRGGTQTACDFSVECFAELLGTPTDGHILDFITTANNYLDAWKNDSSVDSTTGLASYVGLKVLIEALYKKYNDTIKKFSWNVRTEFLQRVIQPILKTFQIFQFPTTDSLTREKLVDAYLSGLLDTEDSTELTDTARWANFLGMARNVLQQWKDDSTIGQANLLALINKLYAKYATQADNLWSSRGAQARQQFLRDVIAPMVNQINLSRAMDFANNPATSYLNKALTFEAINHWEILKQHAGALSWDVGAALGVLNNDTISKMRDWATGLIQLHDVSRLAVLIEYLYSQYKVPNATSPYDGLADNDKKKFTDEIARIAVLIRASRDPITLERADAIPLRPGGKAANDRLAFNRGIIQPADSLIGTNKCAGGWEPFQLNLFTWQLFEHDNLGNALNVSDVDANTAEATISGLNGNNLKTNDFLTMEQYCSTVGKTLAAIWYQLDERGNALFNKLSTIYTEKITPLDAWTKFLFLQRLFDVPPTGRPNSPPSGYIDVHTYARVFGPSLDLYQFDYELVQQVLISLDMNNSGNYSAFTNKIDTYLHDILNPGSANGVIPLKQRLSNGFDNVSAEYLSSRLQVLISFLRTIADNPALPENFRNYLLYNYLASKKDVIQVKIVGYSDWDYLFGKMSGGATTLKIDTHDNRIQIITSINTILRNQSDSLKKQDLIDFIRDLRQAYDDSISKGTLPMDQQVGFFKDIILAEKTVIDPVLGTDEKVSGYDENWQYLKRQTVANLFSDLAGITNENFGDMCNKAKGYLTTYWNDDAVNIQFMNALAKMYKDTWGLVGFKRKEFLNSVLTEETKKPIVDSSNSIKNNINWALLTLHQIALDKEVGFTNRLFFVTAETVDPVTQISNENIASFATELAKMIGEETAKKAKDIKIEEFLVLLDILYQQYADNFEQLSEENRAVFLQNIVVVNASAVDRILGNNYYANWNVLKDAAAPPKKSFSKGEIAGIAVGGVAATAAAAALIGGGIYAGTKLYSSYKDKKAAREKEAEDAEEFIVSMRKKEIASSIDGFFADLGINPQKIFVASTKTQPGFLDVDKFLEAEARLEEGDVKDIFQKYHKALLNTCNEASNAAGLSGKRAALNMTKLMAAVIDSPDKFSQSIELINALFVYCGWQKFAPKQAKMLDMGKIADVLSEYKVVYDAYQKAVSRYDTAKKQEKPKKADLTNLQNAVNKAKVALQDKSAELKQDAKTAVTKELGFFDKVSNAFSGGGKLLKKVSDVFSSSRSIN